MKSNFQVFTPSVWAIILLTLAIIAILFSVVHSIYKSRYFPTKMVQEANSNFDFYLLTFSSLLEPDPLPWFPKMSAGEVSEITASLKQTTTVIPCPGRSVVLVWSILALFVNMFYNCNLRARLIAKKYESPVESFEDALARGLFSMASITRDFVFV